MTLRPPKEAGRPALCVPGTCMKLDAIVGNVSVLCLNLPLVETDSTKSCIVMRVKFLSWSFDIHYMACQVNSAATDPFVLERAVPRLASSGWWGFMG